MRAIVLVATLCLSGGALASTPNTFDGTWTGPGIWEKGWKDTELATTTQLTISESDSQFRFEECWDYQDRDDNTTKHSCIESSYDRDAATNALSLNGKRVGDIFPDHVQIFSGSSQVGEQIVIEMPAAGKLRYRYSYLNFDGETERREAELSPAR